MVTDDVLEIPLEAQGLSVFGSNHVDGERGYERLIAHELAHQWFGNSLTVSRWQHIWLNEGFACYSEWLWSEVSGCPSASKLAERSRAELAGQPQDLVIADPGPKLMFDDRLYQRGALTLHALRHTIGEQEFFDLLRSCPGGNRHANVTTAEFIAHCERFGSATLDTLFRSWLYEAKLPSMPSST